MRRSRALTAIGLLLVIAGCQRPPEAPAPAAVVDHVAEARQALAGQNWAAAAPHLRAALQKDAESLFLHYNLAICATWLDGTDEATREFEWVVAHAPGGSEEAKTARQWLADNRSRAPAETAAEPAANDPTVGTSGLRGTVAWAEPGQSPTSQSRQQLVLAGLRDGPTRERIYLVRADREGRYEFKRIVPGPYKLRGEAAGGRTRWRLKVVLEPGQDLALDLTPENGLPGRDDFPEDR